MRDRKLKKQPREGERLPFVPPSLPPFLPPSLCPSSSSSSLHPLPPVRIRLQRCLMQGDPGRALGGGRSGTFSPFSFPCLRFVLPASPAEPARRSGAACGAECSRRTGGSPSPAGGPGPGRAAAPALGAPSPSRRWAPGVNSGERRDCQELPLGSLCPRPGSALVLRGALQRGGGTAGKGSTYWSVPNGFGVPVVSRWCFGDAPEHVGTVQFPPLIP